MSELYSKLNIVEDNNEEKIMLIILESIHQIMCDMVFGYKNNYQWFLSLIMLD